MLPLLPKYTNFFTMRLKDETMKKDNQKTLEQKIHEAICYRMVSYIGSTEMAHQCGFLPNSLGYKEAKIIFAKRYSLMTFEDFHDDLIVAYMNNVITKDKHKLTMGKVLEEDEINEQRRPLYTKTNEQYKEFIEKIRLSGMNERLLVFQNEVENNINFIDEIWEQLIKYTQNDILFSKKETDIKIAKPSWTLQEIDEVIKGIDMIQQIGQDIFEQEYQSKPRDMVWETLVDLIRFHTEALSVEVQLSNEIRNWHQQEIEKAHIAIYILYGEQITKWEEELEQDFLEGNIREKIQYIKDVAFEQGNVNSIDAEKIRLFFNERLNTLEVEKKKESSRARTKATILEKILNGSVSAITANRFIDEFLQVQEFYELISNDAKDLGSLINFYNIEQELNIGIYAILAYELAVYGKIPKKQQKALVEKVAELAMMDNCLSRQRQAYLREMVTEEIETWDKEEGAFKTKKETYEDKGIGMALLVSDICQEYLEGGEKLWEKYKKEMRQLLKLKYTVLNSMPQHYEYTDKVYRYLGTKTKESVKQHLNQLYEIENKQVFVYLKMLLEENNRVVQERTACILKMR